MAPQVRSIVAGMLFAVACVSPADPVTYDFEVVTYSGARETGYFSYDDSEAAQGATFYSPADFFSDFYFIWNGVEYDETSVKASLPSYNQDDSLARISFGTHCSTTGCSTNPYEPSWFAVWRADSSGSPNYFTGGSSISLTIRPRVPPPPTSLVLPDINSDGIAEIAVVRDYLARMEVRSGSNGALLTTIPFLDRSVVHVDAKLMPASYPYGYGPAMVAVLARDKEFGSGKIEVRRVPGGEALGNVEYRESFSGGGYKPIAFAVLPTSKMQYGRAEFVVLSARATDGAGLIEVDDMEYSGRPVQHPMSVGQTPVDIDLVGDVEADGFPEVAVLAARNSDGRVSVRILEPETGTTKGVLWFMAGSTAIDLAVVGDSDGNGIQEVAVLLRRSTDGRLAVEIKNIQGATNTRTIWFAPGHTGIAVEPVGDPDGNTVLEVAVLSKRDSDGRVLVEVKNAVGATNPRSYWYPAGYAAHDLTVLPDVNGSGIYETGTLLVRTVDGRVMLRARDAAGTASPRDYWFSP